MATQATHMEILITKIFGTTAGVCYTLGTIIATLDESVGLVFKILSCISLVFVIAVNYAKGIEQMKQWCAMLKPKKKP